jgi:peroxiredoxin
LRGIQKHLGEFEQRGIRVAAISVDSPEISRKLCGQAGFTYTFLSDPKAEVIRRYDLLHAGASPDNADIARPAEFLIDASGVVRWVNLTDDFRIRARPEQMLQVIDAQHF